MRGRHICRVGHIQVRRPLETSQSDRRSDYVLRPARRNSESQRSAGSPMRGIEIPSLTKEERLAARGW